MDRPDSFYLHGTSPEEQARLSALNELMNEDSLRALALRGGERILDVGSGLAQLTRAMGRAVGADGCVIGVEASADQLAAAREGARRAGEEELVEIRQGDVLDLPLSDTEWGSFDIAHARFLLEHVSDPQVVVSAMVRAVRPGGRIVLQDDDHEILRVWPEPAGFYELWNAYIEAFKTRGLNPYVGRHLVSLLHQAGAAPRRNACLNFGSCAGHPTFGAFVSNFVGILEGARETILTAELLEESGFEKALGSFREWACLPDATLWYGAAWAEGIRR